MQKGSESYERGAAPAPDPYRLVRWLPLAFGLIVVLEWVALRVHLYDFANAWGPIGFGLASLVVAFFMLKGEPVLFLSAFPWILIANAAYFAVGPLLHVLANDDTRLYPPHLRISGSELLRTNLLNSMFAFAVSAVYAISLCFGKARAKNFDLAKRLRNDDTIILLVVLCLCVGLPIRLLLSFPAEFGMLDLSGGIVPFLLRVGRLSTLALLPLAFLCASRSAWYLIPGVIVFGVEFGFAILAFAKSAVLMSVLLPLIGVLLVRPSKRNMMIAAAVVLTVYLLVAPLVTLCREITAARTGRHYTANWSQRVEILREGVTQIYGGRSDRADSRLNRGWRRLNYSNVQAWVMARYDSGVQLDRYRHAFWVLVPRFISPDKPLITDIGLEMSYLINGHWHSSVGIGVAAEAYSVGGHVMVLLIGVLVGAICVFVDRQLSFASCTEWLYLPMHLLIMRMGVRLDGALVADYLGSLVIICGYWAFIKVLLAVLGRGGSCSVNPRV